MIFKRFSRIKKQDFSVETKVQRLLRLSLILLLFFLVLFGLWEIGNTQKRYMVQASGPVLDETGELSPPMVRQLERYSQRFKKTYGVSLYIRIHKFSLPPERLLPGYKADVVSLDICPATREAAFFAPPLVLAALGPDLATALRGPHFTPWFENGNWAQGLAEALNRITIQLDAALSGSASQGTDITP